MFYVEFDILIDDGPTLQLVHCTRSSEISEEEYAWMLRSYVHDNKSELHLRQIRSFNGTIVATFPDSLSPVSVAA